MPERPMTPQSPDENASHPLTDSGPIRPPKARRELDLTPLLATRRYDWAMLEVTSDGVYLSLVNAACGCVRRHDLPRQPFPALCHR